jgi:phytoene desaturase
MSATTIAAQAGHAGADPSDLRRDEPPLEQMDREAHVVVLGGGLAGLSSAVSLLSRGFRVTIVEQNTHLGGKMNVLTTPTERGDFTFDMGPTILTMPAVARGVIRRAGRRVEDYIDFVRLDPQWRCMYNDGTVIDLREDTAVMAQAMDEQFPGMGVGEAWRSFIEYSRRMFRLSERVFFYKDLESALDLMKNPPKPKPDGLLGDVLAMRMHSTVGKTIERMIPEPHLRQLAEHFLQYVGSSPFMAPAILTLIASAQTDQGCWYAMGGTRSVAQAFARICREYEAGGQCTILLGETASRIITERGAATGVQLGSGETIQTDAVVSNCDIQRTYRDLIGSAPAAAEQKRIASKYAPACSGVVLYLALDRQYEHLSHHDFLFSGDSHKEFDDIYRKGVPAEDATLYLCAPSRTDPSQAPQGCEALYILVHTAALRNGEEWGTRGTGGVLDRYRPAIMNTLKTTGRMPDIEEHILAEHHLTPNAIDRLYNAEGGAIYGLASHGRLRGGFKPRNRSRAYRKLYFAGGSTNPGPGVPMVVMSGVTAARAVAQDFGLTDPDAAYTADNQREAGIAAAMNV